MINNLASRITEAINNVLPSAAANLGTQLNDTLNLDRTSSSRFPSQITGHSIV